MDIEIREIENKGFAIAREHNKKIGIMSYSIPDSDFIIIDHTVVEPEQHGKGVGKKLLYEIIKMVREKNLKILPLCPFANEMFQRLDDIKDLQKH